MKSKIFISLILTKHIQYTSYLLSDDIDASLLVLFSLEKVYDEEFEIRDILFETIWLSPSGVDFLKTFGFLNDD